MKVVHVGVDACIDPRADASIRPYSNRAMTLLVPKHAVLVIAF